MSGDLFTVNRLVPAEAILGPRSSQRLLSVLRGIVRDIRRVNPCMAGYHLYDISFQRRDDKIDIRLYFHGEGATVPTATPPKSGAPTVVAAPTVAAAPTVVDAPLKQSEAVPAAPATPVAPVTTS